ncbi:toprim domain-containing protein, partial [Mesorhizobium sp.]
ARGSPDAARRLFAMSQPIAGTLAERYLACRGIRLAARERALRFHPGCYYRDLVTGETRTLPALIAAVTSLDGRITGLQRTWLDPNGNGKAPVADPRRSLGNLLGNAIWLGMEPSESISVMVAGEGFETMASLRVVMPKLSVAAATSANHLAGLSFPPDCRRLYIAADADAAGRHGIERLSRRAGEAGNLAIVLRPQLGDFNDDLRHLGPTRLAAWLSDQLAPEDARRFLTSG